MASLFDGFDVVSSTTRKKGKKKHSGSKRQSSKGVIQLASPSVQNVTAGPPSPPSPAAGWAATTSWSSIASSAKTEFERDLEAEWTASTVPGRMSAPSQMAGQMSPADRHPGFEQHSRAENDEPQPEDPDPQPEIQDDEEDGLGWSTIQSRPRKSQPKDKQSAPAEREAAEIPNADMMISTFKTVPCLNRDYHDRQQCTFYHDGGNDQRRDPTIQYYSIDEARNGPEKSYHPLVFRTTLCHKPAAAGAPRACPFGPFCAFAHSKESIRLVNHAQMEAEYISKQVHRGAGTRLKMPGKVSVHYTIPDACSPGHPCARDKSEIELPLDEFQLKVVRQSEKLWKRLHRIESKHLCHIERREGPPRLVTVGSAERVKEAARDVDALIKPEFPPDIVQVFRKVYGPGIINRVDKRLETDGTEAFVRDSNVSMQIIGKQIVIRAILQSKSSKRAGEEVIERIEFWLREESLDGKIWKTVECLCCYAELNVDAGISCRGGHFVCCSDGEESCFPSLLDSQIQSIEVQDGKVLCPICKDPFKDIDMARCTSAAVWSKLQGAQVDAKVRDALRPLDCRTN